MHKIADCGVDIADEHEADRDLSFPREKVDSEEVEAHDKSAVCDGLDQRPPSRRSSLTRQLLCLRCCPILPMSRKPRVGNKKGRLNRFAVGDTCREKFEKIIDDIA